MVGPGYDEAAAAAGRGRMRASHADRDQMIDALKTAFVQGRLTKDELDARIGQTLAAGTYAELATVTADIPAGPAGAQPPPPKPPPWRPALSIERLPITFSGWLPITKVNSSRSGRGAG